MIESQPDPDANVHRTMGIDTTTRPVDRKTMNRLYHIRWSTAAAWLTGVAVLTCIRSAPAEDWVRFRGPNGTGISDAQVPTTWSESENLRWKLKLPGSGRPARSWSARGFCDLLLGLWNGRARGRFCRRCGDISSASPARQVKSSGANGQRRLARG